MQLLGIESSCDETAAAIVTDARKILANIVLSQDSNHAPYGGVVPEIAARVHIDHMDRVIRRALEKSGLGWADIDAVAATCGPGLIGGVIVGAMTGKALASVLKKPFIAVNHLEGHALTARLSDGIEFPYLLLLASGGHCQVLEVLGVGKYVRLGGTLDDAIGEAFDKIAKLLGLGFPGGPKVEALAKQGDPKRFAFPRPLKGRPGCDFSFSGLKTAVRAAASELATLTVSDKADLCASFQAAACEVVKDRLNRALALFVSRHNSRILVVAGGVAANLSLRHSLDQVARDHACHLIAPPINLCTDNAAMIAWAGIERFRLGLTEKLNFEPRARWELAPSS